MNVCKHCGAKTKNKLFCSDKCKTENHERVLLERQSIAPKCATPTCLELTIPKRGIGKYTKYCSPECRTKNQKTKTQRRISATLGPAPVCLNHKCSSRTTKNKNHNTYRKFCCRTCYDDYHNEVQQQKITECASVECNNLTKNNTYCSVRCSNTDPAMIKIRTIELNRKYKNNPIRSHISKSTFDKLRNKQYLINNLARSCQDIADELGVSYYAVLDAYKRCNIRRNKNSSSFEDEVVNFLTEIYDGPVVRNSRKIIPPKEIDIFLPELELAIECNGAYWHSEHQGRDKKHHIDKTNLCSAENIQLIHLWDYVWKNNTELVKSRLQAKIGLNTKIFARKCTHGSVSGKEATEFLKVNHVQGNYSSPLRYGLYHNNELVALMTFSKSRYNKNYDYELVRYCTKQRTNITGGPSRLFSKFIKEHPGKSVISYSNKEWNTGKLYEALGFTHVRTTDPSYYYTTNYLMFENRIAYQKHKLVEKLAVYDPELTEWENMQTNGYDRIWDCGNDVWAHSGGN